MGAPRSVQAQVIALVASTFLSFASLAFAQEASREALENTIRKALLEDVRTQNLSPEELNEIVADLRERAYAEGVAEDYIAQTTLQEESSLLPGKPSVISEGGLYASILASLAIACVLFFIVRRGVRKEMALE